MGEVAQEKNKNFGEFPQSECVHGNVNAEHNVTTKIRERELVERGGKTEVGDRIGTEALKAEIQVAGLA
jgi:hypothetical protein